MSAMTSRRWKRARATVELCERRRRHRDGTSLTPRDRYRYAITLSYPVEGDLWDREIRRERGQEPGGGLPAPAELPVAPAEPTS